MKYHVTYKLESHPEGADASEIQPGTGACHAVLIHSIIYPEDGSYSHLFVSLDGRTGKDLTPNEEWKAWMMLGQTLLQREQGRDNLDPGKLDILRTLDAEVRALLEKRRKSSRGRCGKCIACLHNEPCLEE